MEEEEEESGNLMEELLAGRISKEMILFGSIVGALLFVVLLFAIISYCRRNKSDITTVNVEQEIVEEQKVLKAYKQRKADS